MADSIVTTLRLIGQRSYISGMDNAARSVSRLERSSDKAEGGLNIFQSRLGGVRGAAGLVTSAVKGMTIALGAVALYTAKTGIQFNANIEQSYIGMKTLLGSSKEAKKVLSQVQSYALKSPLLSVDSSMKAVQQLIGSGMKAKPAVKTLTAFSDTLSAMGRSPEEIQRLTYAFAQMTSKGKIQAEELRGQLGEIFPAAKILAREMFKMKTKDPHKQMQMLTDAMKAGEVDASNLSKLVRGMKHDFGGATLAQAKTFNGQITNIKENFRYTAGLVTKELFNGLKGKVLPQVQKIQKGVQKWAKGGGMKRGANALTAGFTKGAGPQTAGYKGMDQTLVKVGAIAKTVFSALKTYALQFWDALKPMEPFIKNVIIPFAIGFAKGVLGGFVALIPIIRIFATVLGWIGTKLAPFKKYIEMIGMAVGFTFGLGKIGVLKFFGKAMEGVIGIVGKLFGWLMKTGGVVGRVVYFFFSMYTKIGGFFASLVAKLPGILGKFVSFGAKAVGAIIKKFLSLGSRVGSALRSAATTVVSGALAFGAKIGSTIGTAIWDALPSWLKSVISATGGALGKAKDAIFGGGGKAPKSHGGAMPTAGGHRTRAHGGLASGSTLVGESGPELLHVPGPGMISPIKNLAGSMSNAVSFQVVAPIYLNQRQIGQAVIDDQSDRMARK